MDERRIMTDAEGFPVLLSDGRPKRKREPSGIRLGRREFPFCDGERVLGPTEALERVLLDDPLSEVEFAHLARAFANPNVLHHAAERLGVIRKRDDDGTIMLHLPSGDDKQHDDDAPTTIDAADDDGPQLVVNLDGGDDATRYFDASAADRLTPVRVAQRLLGQPVIGSGLTIVREGNDRFVSTTELEKRLAKQRRVKDAGAAERITNEIADAKERAKQGRNGPRICAAELTADEQRASDRRKRVSEKRRRRERS
jgi:hypothetical protein